MRTTPAIGSIAAFGWLIAAAIGCGDDPSSTSPSPDPESVAPAQPGAATAGSPATPAPVGQAPASPAAMTPAAPSGNAKPAEPPATAPTTPTPATPSTPTPTQPPVTTMPTAPADTIPTLFYLNNLGGVLRAGDDGKNAKTIVSGSAAGSGPDGVAVDVAGGHVFWTTMGVPNGDDGTIMRADLDGKNLTTVVKSGGTFTPKQLKLEGDKLYWSDREGMRVMRANLDGSQIETLVATGKTDADRNDASRWCVGIAVDLQGGKIYWSQKGGDNGHVGAIKRAGLELPAGQDPATRDDIEVLFAKLPEPIDLDLDLDKRLIYWTDRGDNTVSRAPLDPPAGADPAARNDREILVKGLGEAIGIALDSARNRMFYSSLSGVVGMAALDGTLAKNLLSGQGTLTGIALAELPK